MIVGLPVTHFVVACADWMFKNNGGAASWDGKDGIWLKEPSLPEREEADSDSSRIFSHGFEVRIALMSKESAEPCENIRASPSTTQRLVVFEREVRVVITVSAGMG